MALSGYFSIIFIVIFGFIDIAIQFRGLSGYFSIIFHRDIITRNQLPDILSQSKTLLGYFSIRYNRMFIFIIYNLIHQYL